MKCYVFATFRAYMTVANGSGDGSLTHFFVNPLDDSVAYSRESGQLVKYNLTVYTSEHHMIDARTALLS